MPFRIIRNDITRMKADAIVNTAAPEPGYGRGTDSAVYRKAGAKRLLAQREKIGKIEEGGAEITSAFSLNARYIVHTAGPIWRGGGHGEADRLRLCYANSLKLAQKYGCRSIAFPLISAGSYGFPKQEALDIAVSEIRSFLEGAEMTVYLVLFDKESFTLSGSIFEGVDSYIDERYVTERMAEEYSEDRAVFSMPVSQRRDSGSEGMNASMSEALEEEAEREPAEECASGSAMDQPPAVYAAAGAPEQEETPGPEPERCRPPAMRTAAAAGAPEQEETPGPEPERCRPPAMYAAVASAVPEQDRSQKREPALFRGRAQKMERSLEDVVAQLGETFQERLLRLIDERGMTDVEVYKRANLDRKLFSKIRCNAHYRPKKMTAVALAVALRLNLDETKDLLSRAELALSPSSKFDLIIEYFIDREVYDVYTINLALFEHEQPLLGDVG